MKTIFILHVFLTCLLAGCSSSQDTLSKNNMQVINATFKQWSEMPRAGSEIPEKGTDLTITVQNWPDDYTADYVVYNERKSLSTTMADSSGSERVITARIVRTSSMLVETSESVELSDRLVFSDTDGASGFIEIDNWKPAEE